MPGHYRDNDDLHTEMLIDNYQAANKEPMYWGERPRPLDPDWNYPPGMEPRD